MTDSIKARAEVIIRESGHLDDPRTVIIRHLREAVAEALEEVAGYLKNRKDSEMVRARAEEVRRGV